MHPNGQERKKEGKQKAVKKREREKNLALNEVLREVHNAVCTVLKDFSSVGVFLYGPQQTHVQGWAGGRLGWWGGVGWGGGGVLVMSPPLLG